MLNNSRKPSKTMPVYYYEKENTKGWRMDIVQTNTRMGVNCCGYPLDSIIGKTK